MRNGENRVDYFRAIEPKEDDAHEQGHHGKIETAQGAMESRTEEDDINTCQESRMPIDGGESTEIQSRGGPNKLHISRKAIDKYVPTEGCPARAAIARRGI